MQEKLLKISINDRGVNLEKYKDIIRQIDEYYFSGLLSDIEQVSEHNQTLEEELEYLEQIVSTYEQVLVEQVKFRNVCELYGDDSLELSDLSMIDREYIDSRRNAISGYLISRKNIDDAKKELDLLSGKLRDEEMNNNDLKKRLLEYEEVLRNNFINAEGRYLNEMKLEYVSILSEYKELGYDFKELLKDSDGVKVILSGVYDEMKDANDKLKTAELCYEKMPSVDSKTILEEISLENIMVRYKLTMIKILELLCRDIDNYDMFLKKRKDLFDLIKYRLEYVKKLGVSVSIDPFSRTKVFEQIKVVEAIPDNSKNIHKIRKSINELNGRLEEMISIRDSQKEEINNIKDIIIEREIVTDVIDDEDISNNDVISDEVMEYLSDDIKDDEKLVFESIRKSVDILDNQVIGVRDISDKLNMDIVSQKTGQVIKRVNEMVNKVPATKTSRSLDVVPELVIEQVDVKDDSVIDGIELVEDVNTDDVLQDDIDKKFSFDGIVSDIIDEADNRDEKKENEDGLSNGIEDTSESKEDDSISENTDVLDKQVGENKEDIEKIKDNSLDVISIDEDLLNSDMFMNIDPFLETPLFTDRTDESDEKIEEVIGDSDNSQDVELPMKSLDDKEELLLNESNNQEIVSDEMPDAFWVVQDYDKDINNNEEDGFLSFDEQVELLTNDNYKKRQLI